MTVKDQINEIRKAAMADIDAELASKYLIKLSALFGSVMSNFIDKEMVYNRRFEEITNQSDKVTDARVKAKASPEYEAKLGAEALVEQVKELMNALKYIIKLKIEEKKESRYQ